MWQGGTCASSKHGLSVTTRGTAQEKHRNLIRNACDAFCAVCIESSTGNIQSLHTRCPAVFSVLWVDYILTVAWRGQLVLEPSCHYVTMFTYNSFCKHVSWVCLCCNVPLEQRLAVVWGSSNLHTVSAGNGASVKYQVVV